MILRCAILATVVSSLISPHLESSLPGYDSIIWTCQTSTADCCKQIYAPWWASSSRYTHQGPIPVTSYTVTRLQPPFTEGARFNCIDTRHGPLPIGEDLRWTSSWFMMCPHPLIPKIENMLHEFKSRRRHSMHLMLSVMNCVKQNKDLFARIEISNSGPGGRDATNDLSKLDHISFLMTSYGEQQQSRTILETAKVKFRMPSFWPFNRLGIGRSACVDIQA